RGRVLGLNGTIFSVGSMLGPSIGGLLLSAFGWRAIFLVNVPVGIAGMILAFRFLPRQQGTPGVRFDVAGSVLAGLSIVSLLLAISQGQQHGWTPPVVALAVLAAALAGAFALWERRTPLPVLRFSLFRRPGFSSALVAQGLTSLANSSTMLLLPFFLVSIQGRSEAQAGAILLASSVTTSITSPLAGWLSDHLEPRYVASAGLAVAVLGYWLYSGVSTGWSVLDVVWRLVVVSLGFGLFRTPNVSAGYRFIRSADRGLAVGTMAFLRNLGFTLGTALAGSIWSLRRMVDGRALGLPAASPQAGVAGLHDTFLVMAGFIVLALVVSVARPASRTAVDLEREAPAASYAERASLSE
ncbi:MAG: MFS transporter, partial [Chloroflexota bacterium]